MTDVARTYAMALVFAVAFFSIPAVIAGGVSDLVSVVIGAISGVTGALIVGAVVYDARGTSLAARSARDFAAVFVTLVTAGVVASVAPSTAIVIVGAFAGTCAVLGLGVLRVAGSHVIDRVTAGESP